MKKITRIFDLLYHQLENHPLQEAFVTKRGGKWESLSTQAYIDKVNRMSRGLLKLGVKPNDKVAVITSANCSEWNILDIGLLQIGAQNVPIYPTSSIEDYHYILNHSEAKYVFVSDQEILEKVNSAKEGGAVKAIYSFTESTKCKNWTSILALGEEESLQKTVEARKEDIKADDLATLIYTSGTTGTPKGVMLTHHNIVSNVLGCASRVPFKVGSERVLSFLPICHVFERLLIYLYQYYSVSVYYAESIDALSENIKEIRPSFMAVVPRVLEKVYMAFRKQGNALSGIKRHLFLWAIALGKRYEPFGDHSWLFMLQLALARKLVLSKWKAALGGRLDLMVSGSAALSPELARLYAAANMTVLEGYGLTETSPVIAVNTTRKEDYRIGTVGKPIDNVEVQIAKDGEVLMKGPNVMQKYYKNEPKTRESFTDDGFFMSGDIGELDEDGFLKITDRKKQLFKTSGGKYIMPQKIENELEKSPFIEHAMVVGEGKKMPAALIQPSFIYLKSWLKHKNMTLKDNKPKTISEEKRVINRIQVEIDLHNKSFGHWEQVKVFKLTPGEWTIEGGELTPTLKVKRKGVIAKYKELYEAIYEEK